MYKTTTPVMVFRIVQQLLGNQPGSFFGLDMVRLDPIERVIAMMAYVPSGRF